MKVSAIRSTHIPGHASYRVDTPAGSVVIGGDAGNDTFAPPRPSSTSAQVETLAKGADIIVHSTIHPVMGPDRDSGMPPPIFHRQSSATDLGAMAQRTGAKHLVLTHLIPPPGAPQQGVLGWIDRRRLVQLLGAGGGAIAAGLPARVFAQARKNTLVLGIDISDTITLDPARLAQYTSPMTVSAAYDSLVTMTARRIHQRQALARHEMGAHAGRQGLALHAARWRQVRLRHAMTVEDVKWSFDRVHQPQGSALAIYRDMSTGSRSSTRRRSTSS